MSADWTGGSSHELHEAQVAVRAAVRACEIEFVDGQPLGAYALRLMVVPGDEFASYLDDDQPPGAGRELIVLLPKMAVSLLIAELEFAALSTLDEL